MRMEAACHVELCSQLSSEHSEQWALRVKGEVKMCCHVSGVTGSRVGDIRAEVKAVVVEGVLTTLLEGKIGIMCDSRWGTRWDMAGINTSVRWPHVTWLTSLISANPLCPHTWLTWTVACVGGWALGWLASVFTQLDTEMVRLSTKKNIVLSYRTELEEKYRTVASNYTYIPEKTAPYHNIVPNYTILHALHITIIII